MKVAITFRDNDYHFYTFENVLRFLNEILKNREENRGKLSKIAILNIINELSYGCYIGFQVRYDKNGCAEGSYFTEEQSKKYLEIPEKDLFLNEEVDALIKENSDNNVGIDTLILDTDLNYPGNNPVYYI